MRPTWFGRRTSTIDLRDEHLPVVLQRRHLLEEGARLRAHGVEDFQHSEDGWHRLVGPIRPPDDRDTRAAQRCYVADRTA